MQCVCLRVAVACCSTLLQEVLCSAGSAEVIVPASVGPPPSPQQHVGICAVPVVSQRDLCWRRPHSGFVVVRHRVGSAAFPC